MTLSVKKYLYDHLSLENYLRLLQQSYFLMYHSGLLRGKEAYKYHYFVKKLIRKGDTVIDIGANLGYYSLLFSNWVGTKGKVYAVEPIALYNKVFMKKARRRKNIELMPYALGTEEKEVTLVTSPGTGYLRTGLPHVYDANRDGKMEEQEFSFDAQMRIPSKLFASIGKIDYIKCDIEGFEYVVLAEMEQLIRRDKPRIQIEVWKQNEADVFGLLEQIGYVAYRLRDKKFIPVTVAEHEAEGDTIFVHRNDTLDKTLL